MTTPGGASTMLWTAHPATHVLGAPAHRVGASLANGLRLFVLDRNICHFLWYGGVAGEGLRSVGEEALPSSKSVCSILPIAICGPGFSPAPALRFAPSRCPNPSLALTLIPCDMGIPSSAVLGVRAGAMGLCRGVLSGLPPICLASPFRW
jgi:hypothetical protein